MMNTPIKKAHLLLLTLLLAFGIILIGCKGPTGDQGPQGPEGEEGPIGPAGEDGSIIHAGSGTPGEDIGKLGDFYLNTTAAEMYGPKTQDGWGVPFSLQGPPGEDGQDGEDGADGQDGADGKDGSQIYSGSGAPAESLGNTDDFYLNKSSFELYGPKTDSGWGVPLNMQAKTNVMYTTWFEPDWSVDRPRLKRMIITESRLTNEFKETGVVLAYRRSTPYRDIGVVYQLPLTVRDISNGEVSHVYRSHVYFDKVYIQIRSFTEDLDPEDYNAERNSFRYVLIPGFENISVSTNTNSLPINLKNYQQTKKYFGIRD
ncbi:hypothetical protein [Fodinibius salsisoli]|uniref:Collagen-like protein n=1 Tax=Fodinibius salsisoli TaxID=2820877 RepID=A0ABT3PQY7_9BACT|nr:hypothetical protein [Fodinibius salsisoli]MCW9708246.1 collagen-like protein [Fodinibius salsisoli]